MQARLNRTLLLLSAAVVTFAPVLIGASTLVLGTTAHAIAGNGHGNGGGNGGGSHGQGGDTHGSAGASDNNSGGTGLTNLGRSKKVASTDSSTKSLNLHAKLAGLNSLNRNINGLMNSSDPRMEQIRSFISASADLAAAEASLGQATLDAQAAQAAYDAFVMGLLPQSSDGYVYSDTSLAALNARLESLNAGLGDPPDPAVVDEIATLTDAIAQVSTSTELATLEAALQKQTDLETAVAAGQAATSDDALIEALMVAANDNRVAQYGDGYVDPALLDWAKQKLGVGDYTGLIDAYIAKN